MDVIYLDRLFGLNLLLDYCLMLASARVCGVVLHRARYLLAALTGALYAAVMVLPGCGWLGSGAMKLALGAAMALIAFGGEAHWARCAVVFFAVSAAFGGAVYAASMLAGVSPGSGARWCFSRFPPRSAARYTQRACSRACRRAAVRS